MTAVFTALGAALLLLGAWLLISRVRLWMMGERAEGTLVGWVERRGDRRVHHMPRVHFLAPDGSWREFVSRVGANPSRWPQGSRLPLIFDPRRPERAEIAIPWRFWAAPAAVLTLAAGVLWAAAKSAGG